MASNLILKDFKKKWLEFLKILVKNNDYEKWRLKIFKIILTNGRKSNIRFILHRALENGGQDSMKIRAEKDLDRTVSGIRAILIKD